MTLVLLAIISTADLTAPASSVSSWIFNRNCGSVLIALRGNHEAMVIDVIDGEVEAEFWLSQGGAQTLRSYGATSADALPRDHVRWLRSLPTSHNDGRRFFAHAGIDPDKPLTAQSEHDLIWIREPFLLRPARPWTLDRARPHTA